MSATTATKPAPATAERVLLRGVSWRSYESLLDDYAETGGHRLTYDHGLLEIMSPLPLHEERKQDVNLLIEQIAIEWRLRYRNFGSTTLRREDLERGAEPDICFYFRNLDQLAGRRQIDLTVDPVPDLAVEIDLTHPSLDRLPVYAQLGVAEVWRYVPEQSLTILLLEQGQYQEVEESRTLPGLTGAIVESFLNDESLLDDRPLWAERVRTWARENQPPPPPG